MDEKERQWELPDRLEAVGISRAQVCAEIFHQGQGCPLDVLMMILSQDGADRKLNADTLLFSHFKFIAIITGKEETYMLVSN